MTFKGSAFLSAFLGAASIALAEAMPLLAPRALLADVPVFEKDIVPILKAHCLSCHGEQKRKADLDLRTLAALLRGGESGVGVKAGSLKDSILWEKIANDRMPPGKDKLSAAEKDVVKRWIENGARGDGKTPAIDLAESSEVSAADRDFWAFRKPLRPALPAVKLQANERIRNPIDAFILAELHQKQLTFSPPASRPALLRRVTFDLIGLPPTPTEIETFLADPAADAYEKVVDRLLASPHYGERWGRHWLDLAGYADSEGILDADYVRSAAWRYRDYVIRAFNSDKPYDVFLQEQLAGDELVDYWKAYETEKTLSPQIIEAVVATGFLRCASDTSRPDFVSIKNAPGYYFQTLDDTVKIVASSTLGLTVQCARCHSHKYDPIPQTDYYRLQAIFMSGYRPGQWVPQVQRRLLEATAHQEKEAKEHNAKIDAAIAGLKKQLQEQQQKFAVDNKSLVQVINQKIQAENKRRRTLAEIRAFYDLPGEAKTHLLRRGDYLNPGREVAPGTLSVLATSRPFDWKPAEKGKIVKSSGRRLAFARWLTQPDHPLTARVAVNRLWLHHFGQGIVATPDNFGRTGAPPSHPQLLDWLACEFTSPQHKQLENGPSAQNPEFTSPQRKQGNLSPWSLKRMHRLLVTSSTYRQASQLDLKAHALARRIDPDNRLFWRQRLRRLEAEALRDAVLGVAGNLNGEMFGPPVPMLRQNDGQVVVAADASGARRSIYLQVRRSQPLTFLQLFDQPVLETNCTRRETSTVASQALTLLNSDFMIRQADVFAERLLKGKAASPAAQAMLLAFGRPATSRELERLAGFLESQTTLHAQILAGPNARTNDAQLAEGRRRALADMCQMLLSANEFAYLD